MNTYLLNERIDNRYQTLIKNIKSKSNSYYDSFLDLLEGTIKYILDENTISYDIAKTCGNIIKEQNVKKFLLEELQLDETIYDKLLDYIKKCNDHKHKKEKLLNIESVINYLEVYFKFLNTYLEYKNLDKMEYDKTYYVSIFGETEKINKKLLEEKKKLTEELESAYLSNSLSAKNLEIYKNIVEVKTLEYLALDEENEKLLNEISLLKDIKFSLLDKKLDVVTKQNEEILEKMNRVDGTNERIIDDFIQKSTKKFVWVGKGKFDKIKKELIILSIIILIVGVLSTIVNVSINKFYTTYSLFENIWLIFTIFILKYVLKADKNMEHSLLKKYSPYQFKYTEDEYFMKVNIKKRYTVFFVLTIISVIGNIIVLFDNENIVLAVINIILELVFLVLIIIGNIKRYMFYIGYDSIISFTGKNSKAEEITIYYSFLHNQFLKPEEFETFLKSLE